MDTDRDLFGDLCDCAPGDASAWAAPGAIDFADIVDAGGGDPTVRLSWTSMAPRVGPGVVYDVLTAKISSLIPAGGFSGANCLANGITVTDVIDPDPIDSETGRIYLLRARNVCAVGSWGDSGQSPDPRDDIDKALDPCP